MKASLRGSSRPGAVARKALELLSKNEQLADGATARNDNATGGARVYELGSLALSGGGISKEGLDVGSGG